MIPPRPTAQSAAPTRSIGVRLVARAAGAMRASTASVAATGTTLMAKTHLHEPASTSAPPASGPSTKEMPVHAVQVPMAFPWAGPSKLAMMSASELGTSSAPATPCNPRATIKICTLGAAAHSADVAAKPTSPPANTRLRPKRSDSEPAVRISDPSAKR